MTDDWSWLHKLIYRLAWPDYECEQCVGQEHYDGGGARYCSYHEAIAPCVGPTRWHLFLRWVWDKAKVANG